MSRPPHPALIPGWPGEWILADWAHRRDSRRVEREFWPFAWTPPAPSTDAGGLGRVHPLSTQTDRQRLERYAVQAELYAQAPGRGYRPGRSGLTPDLIIVDEISRTTGTELHRLVEEFESGQAPAGSAAWRRRNGGV